MGHGFYDKHILPRLIHIACGVKPVRNQRQKVLPRAKGRVLEIGIGSGLNLPYYDASKVEKLWGLEPAAEILRMAEKAAISAPFPVEFIGVSGEEIPLETGTVDTVVTTYTLCTIPDAVKALSEMRRVLKSDGKLLFLEHGQAPDAAVCKWQDRLTPLWKRIGGGCHLNRDIPNLLRRGGFDLIDLETMYIQGPKPLTFNYWGAARPS